jgi:cytidylate kinase
MAKHPVITIGRQFGSGGHVIGEEVAKRLNIPFYDKELLTIAAQQSGFCEEVIESFDENPSGSFLYSLATGSYSTMPLNHEVFLAQFQAIQSVAQQGACVIVGRCADYALEQIDLDCLRVFIHAPLEARVDRIVRIQDIDSAKARSLINKQDKRRASYYAYYAERRWGDMTHYDLCLNSQKTGVNGAVDVILAYAEALKKKETI